METETKVAPILNTEKQKYFFSTLFSTLLGFSFLPWTDSLFKIFNLTFYIPSLFIFLFTMLAPFQYMVLAIISSAVSTVFIWVWLLLKYCLVDRKQTKQRTAIIQAVLVLKFIIIPISCYLAFNHFYISKGSVWISVVSFITCLGSITTIYSDPIREFGVMNEESNNLSIRSTYLVRVYITNAVLIPETVLYFLGYGSIVSALQIVYCFLFALWWIGLLSDIASTTHIFVNWINYLVFGEQNKVYLYRAFITLIINAGVSIGIIAVNKIQNYFIIVNCVLMGTALITSSFANTLCCFTLNSQIKQKHYYLQYILEIILLVGKIVLTVFLPQIQHTTFLILFGIDIFIYLLLSLILDFSKSKTFIGTKQLYTISPVLKNVFRIIMRSITDVCFIFLANELLKSNIYLEYQFICGILIYRSYKRSIYEPFSFGIHLSFVLVLALSNIISIWIIPLCMVPLPDNSFLMFVASFVIPKKNVHKCEGAYKILYLLASIFGLIVVFVSFGLLQPIMLFGLPVFLWSLPLNNQPILNGHGKDKSIHQHLSINLKSTISSYDVGTYLLRISKYLVIARVIQKGIGYQIVQFRGLEAQEVTSCHGIEAQTVDNMVEETWGQKVDCRLGHLITSLRPLQKHPYHLFESNEISLVGIIDTRQFAIQLKKNFMKTLLYLMNKQKYQEKHKQELHRATKQINEIANESQIQKYKLTDFMAALGIPFPQTSHKKTLPPIKKESIRQMPKPQPKVQLKKSQNLFDDFDFMMSPDKNKQNKKSPVLVPEVEQGSNLNLMDHFQQVEESGMKKKLFSDESPKSVLNGQNLRNASIFQMAVVICIYSFGARDFVDQKKLFELLSSANLAQKVLKNVQLPTKGSLVNKAARFSFKLTVEQYINGEDQTTLDDIKEIESSDHYVGVLGQTQFEKAVQSKIQTIWSLDYKDGIKVNRFAQREVELYLFGLNQFLVKSIWNNLRFELLYATNDDDQRYSIQTHPHFLRNILIEGAVEPLGYAPYYTGYQKIESF